MSAHTLSATIRFGAGTGVIASLLLLFSLPRPAAAQAGRFSTTGSASNARTLHSATLLPNGKVLVAGGFNPGGPTIASAEVYDPNTGLFSATGSLNTARRDHTATLLPNGKVLIAGGRLPPAYAGAEVYDPDTGRFTPTGSMSTPRANHTATLLSNGKVLVTGGLNAGATLASAELYEPNTGIFTPTGGLNTARATHTATLLPDGRVLIAGGDNGTTTAFASAELYDPDTGKFSTTGSMSTARTIHAATLLPPSTVRPHGKVLITGGGSNPTTGVPYLASAEIYDPDTGAFSPTGSMSSARWYHSATLLPAYELRPHGKVLIAGGDMGRTTVLASAELYDPDTGHFSPTGSLITGRTSHTATLLPNGAVLFAEGDNYAHAFASAELYALPPTYTITDLGTLPGGTSSQANFVSDHGLIAGLASSADGTHNHAVVWYNGQIGDISLPGLGGLGSSAWGLNEMGQVIGGGHSSTLDPNNENFCGAGSPAVAVLICLPFLWQNGVMTALPTLGGPNGGVGQINNRGEVAGIAETGTKDKNCPPGVSISGTGPQVLDFEAVIWGPQPGQIRQLNPLPGDTVGMALWINDNGQAVGASGTCANSALPPLAFGSHAVLWEADGSVTDLGNLGGAVANIGLAINNQGQVVGASSLNDQATPFESNDAFLWTRETGMRDLGTLPGDVNSVGLGINDRGEVVGQSGDADGNSRGFLYENGVMYDLNTLIPAGSPLFVLFASAINSSGEIVGFGMTKAGDMHAFLATPTSGEDVSGSFSSAAQGVTSPMALSEDARKTLQQRLRSGRFGGRLMGPR
jgi:probable HAF family extracellular repeat protein